MLKALRLDLDDLYACIDDLQARLPRMLMSEKVDVAARLGSAKKSIEAMDELIKTEIKDKLKHRAGTLPGENFQAELALVPTTRLDTKALKEGEPETYEAYCKRMEVERVNFKPKG